MVNRDEEEKKKNQKKKKMTLMCWRLLCEMPIILSIHSELSKWCMTWVEAGSAEGGLQSCPSGMQVSAQNLPSQTYRGRNFCGADSTLGQRKKERVTTHYNKRCHSQFATYPQRVVLKFHLHQDLLRNFVKIQRPEPFPRDLLSLYTYGIFWKSAFNKHSRLF